MNDAILRRELRRIAIEHRHRCFGCGFEHNCGIHGCAIIREALERLEQRAPAKLDRSRWEGCWSCNNPRVRNLGLRNGREYCPCCGKPLTGKAWAELERRI